MTQNIDEGSKENFESFRHNNVKMVRKPFEMAIMLP